MQMLPETVHKIYILAIFHKSTGLHHKALTNTHTHKLHKKILFTTGVKSFRACLHILIHTNIEIHSNKLDFYSDMSFSLIYMCDMLLFLHLG